MAAGTPLGAGLPHPCIRAAEDEEQRRGCSSPWGRQRVPLWGCEAACGQHGRGFSVPADTAELVGDALAC